MKPDLQTTNLGTIIQINATSRQGLAWLKRHVDAPGIRSGLERGVECDHRMGIDILHAALAAGLRLRDTTTAREAHRA